MKLYGTITSERATKGQGGKYLIIEIFDENKNSLWGITVKDNTLKVNKGYNEFNEAKVIFTDTKGKRQKGEVWCYQEHKNGKYGGVTGKHIHD